MSFIFDNHQNFTQTQVAIPPANPTTGTSFTVSSGTGALFPAPPFNCVVCAANQVPNAGNAEVIRVTNINGNVFTVVRSRENSTTQSIQAGYVVYLAVTAKVFTDIEAAINNLYVLMTSGGMTGLCWYNTDAQQWYTKACVGNPPQDEWIPGATGVSIRYNDGVGMQWFNNDTGLWHTRMCVGNPPQSAWDAGTSPSAPYTEGDVPEINGNVQFNTLDSNVRLNRALGYQWYNPDTNLWHTQLCVSNPAQDAWDSGSY